MAIIQLFRLYAGNLCPYGCNIKNTSSIIVYIAEKASPEQAPGLTNACQDKSRGMEAIGLWPNFILNIERMKFCNH